MDNITELNPRRGRRESVSDEAIDAAIAELQAALGGRWPSGEAVYEHLGRKARTRCFERLRRCQRQAEARRLATPYQLPETVLETLQLAMTRLEQDAQDRVEAQKTQWELERVALHQKVAEAHKRECAEIYRREDLEKQLAALEHQLVVVQADNTRLLERNEALHRLNEQHKAQAEAAQQIAEERRAELEGSRELRAQLEQALDQYRQDYPALQARCVMAEAAHLSLQAMLEGERQLATLAQTQWDQQKRFYEQRMADLKDLVDTQAHAREVLATHTQRLQEQLATLPTLIESGTGARVEHLWAELKAQFQALHEQAITQEALWQSAYAKATQFLLAQGGLKPEAFRTAQGAVQRLLWGVGSHQDIADFIEALKADEAIRQHVVFPEEEPSVTAFKALAQQFQSSENL